MALGDSFTCALRDDGKGFCWGSVGSGQIGDGSAWKNLPTLVKNLP